MRKLTLFLIVILIPSICFGAASTSMDGANDEVDMGAVLNVTTGDVSGCWWGNFTENATADFVMGKKNDGAAGSAGYAIRCETGDTASMSVSDGVEQGNSLGTTDLDGAWFWVCGTFQASNETTTIYTNGVSEDTDAIANVDSLTNAVEFAIGESGSEQGDTAGLLAHVSQYSAVLTVVEINEKMWKPEMIPTSRGAYWPLWDTGGDTTTENDIGGANLDGTVSGATDSSSGTPVMFGGMQ